MTVSMSMLQLNPMLPVTTPKGKGFCFLIIDYSQEHHLHYVVIQDINGEIWTWNNTQIRAQTSVTLQRLDLSDI